MTEKITLSALVSQRRHPPTTANLSLVEAASFIAFGGFIGSVELETLLRSEIEHGKEGAGTELDLEHEWSRARAEILALAGRNALTLYGRSAPRFGDGPIGELAPIPVDFFLAEAELVLGSTDTLYLKNDPNRTMYYEVRIKTDEFTRAFPAAKSIRRGGSKPLYDWPSFIAEAVEQLDQEGDFCPGWRQGDLETHMAKWCSVNWEKGPSEASIRTRVKEAHAQFLRQRAQG